MINMIKEFSFQDFQKIMEENNARPIYSIIEDKYILAWTSGGFIYQTTILKTQIYNAYEKFFGKKNDSAAIKKFEETYLSDCYKETLPNSEELISLFEAIKPVLRESDWHYQPIKKLKDMMPKSLFVKEKNGKKHIMGIEKNSNNISTLGILELKHGRLQAKDREGVIKGEISSTQFALQTDLIENADPEKIAERIKKMEEEIMNLTNKKNK